MPSKEQFKDYILEQLRGLNEITVKRMMGEYLLYLDGVLFGGIYDNRLLIKITESNKAYTLKEDIPYPNAKPMYLVENIDDSEYLINIIKKTVEYLKIKKA